MERLLYAQGMTPRQARRLSLRDAFQVVRGYQRRQRDSLEAHARMHEELRKTLTRLNARTVAAVVNSPMGAPDDPMEMNDLLPEELRVEESTGMSKERLRANYEQYMKDHGEP